MLYRSEAVRAGILAVPRRQGEARTPRGLHAGQRFRLIVGRQALKVIVPPLGNSVNERLRGMKILVQEIFTIVAIDYLAMTAVWGLVQRRLKTSCGRGYVLDPREQR